MSLAKFVFNITPDWLRVRLFDLTEEERFFLQVIEEKRATIREYICSEETGRREIVECKHMMQTMEFLLNRYGKEGRFYKYFVEKSESLMQDIKAFSRYH